MVIQEDYEDVNTGSEFTMHTRYAQVLTTLFTIFMYSAGLPLLYLVGFANFFFTYWVDKFLCKCCIKCELFYSAEMEPKASRILASSGEKD
jgi:hypothetical protein